MIDNSIWITQRIGCQLPILTFNLYVNSYWNVEVWRICFQRRMHSNLLISCKYLSIINHKNNKCTIIQSLTIIINFFCENPSFFSQRLTKPDHFGLDFVFFLTNSWRTGFPVCDNRPDSHHPFQAIDFRVSLKPVSNWIKWNSNKLELMPNHFISWSKSYLKQVAIWTFQCSFSVKTIESSKTTIRISVFSV